MVSITRILVPTDFSAASDAALTYARSLARQFGASINLVHVFEDPFASGAFLGDGIVTMPLDLRESLERAAREQLATRHAEHVGTLPLSSTDLLTGSAARRIVEHAETTRCQPDRHGDARPRRAWPPAAGQHRRKGGAHREVPGAHGP